MFLQDYLKAVVFAQCLHLAAAYPGGVPDLACSTMFPSGHYSEGQSTASPYRIITQKTTYKPGETISLNVIGEQAIFTGLYVQARRVGCRVNGTRAVGAFTVSDSRLQTRHCFGLVHSAVSHTSSSRKDSVSLYWTAPVVPSGHLVFRATILKDRSTFWLGVESAPLVYLQTEDILACDRLSTGGHKVTTTAEQGTRGGNTAVTHNVTLDAYVARASQEMSSVGLSTGSTLQYIAVCVFATSIYFVLL